jgi:DNA-directed RNA polymerase specialized sigma subunit
MARLPKQKFAKLLKKTLREQFEIKDNDIIEILNEIKPTLLKTVDKLSFSRFYAIIKEILKEEYGNGISQQRLKKILDKWLKTLPENERNLLVKLLEPKRKRKTTEDNNLQGH